MKYRTILLFGAPGAGKGTQGKILGTIPGFFHCACGDVFRNLRIDHPMGRLFIEYASKGKLVPDEPTIELWRKNIEAATVQGAFNPERDWLVLDGIPRNPAQAVMMKKYVKVLKVIHLVCPDKTKMIERLQRRALKENRFDDAKIEVIQRRWEVYEKETYPVLDCYPSNLIAEVDAMGSPARVLQHVLEHLVPVQEAHFRNPITGEPVTT